jgi:hypothetical protein
LIISESSAETLEAGVGLGTYKSLHRAVPSRLETHASREEVTVCIHSIFSFAANPRGLLSFLDPKSLVWQLLDGLISSAWIYEILDIFWHHERLSRGPDPFEFPTLQSLVVDVSLCVLLDHCGRLIEHGVERRLG